MDEHAAVRQLQDILIGTEGVEDFLDGLAGLAAATLSDMAGTAVECAVTLKHQEQTINVAGNSPRARQLDQLQKHADDGPCPRALQTMEPQLLHDARTDARWPDYRKQLLEHAVNTTLAFPLNIGDDAGAALNFFGPEPRTFTPELVRKATAFGELASSALHLSARIGAAQTRARNLEVAMRSRTAIDIACGVIMAQNGCSQKEAVGILTKVSSNRNHKLRDVAAELVTKLSGTDVQTHFD
ncbi:GAF and ANTAR domain-containing protein [Arthrobacter sp. NPDC056691]|uniref:GAF and ANTAR domain-containing protein n=1 Tax=Arthrobacter sp. NPDC056691 TaxID=3345913 RepID=UPI003671CBF8